MMSDKYFSAKVLAAYRRNERAEKAKQYGLYLLLIGGLLALNYGLFAYVFPFLEHVGLLEVRRY